MRLLFLNQYFLPDDAATAQLASDLGAELVRRGHDVWAVASARPYGGASVGVRTRSERRAGIKIRRVGATAFGRSSRLARVIDYGSYLCGSAWALRDLPPPDVVIALSTPPFVVGLGAGLAALRDARLVYWAMDVYPDLAIALGAMRRGGIAARGLEAAHAFLLRRADRVIALDDAMADTLRSAGAGAERVRVIDNWSVADDATPPRAVSESRLRTTLGLGDRFVLGYSGNFGLAHDFDTLLDAAEHLAPSGRFGWLFIGDGPQRARIERFVARHPDAARLLPPRPLEALPDALAACDALYISMHEAVAGLLVPSKLYGALAAARPIVYVGPDRGRVAEVVRDEQLGSLSRNRDADGLAAALRALAADGTARAAAGSRARALFDRRFTRAHALSAHCALLDELAPR